MPGKGPMLQGGCYANVVQLPVKPPYSVKSMGFQSSPLPLRRRNRFMDKGSLNLDLEARKARPPLRAARRPPSSMLIPASTRFARLSFSFLCPPKDTLGTLLDTCGYGYILQALQLAARVKHPSRDGELHVV
ncbi:hypothetical protein CCUS01_03672 [Colletotrichum cuscutae]|uniref:Uncharacterized protein n=1 Tax=Colletotrichum cuscutae TaxID=1209917 RepID=A0AAI9VIL1_9PEZI|nr:hypothetical protein CCUS01_03672 [Colletotrichum cuscutae]